MMFLLKLISYIFGKNNVLKFLAVTTNFLIDAEKHLRNSKLETNEEFYELKHSQDVFETWLKLFDEDL